MPEADVLGNSTAIAWAWPWRFGGAWACCCLYLGFLHAFPGLIRLFIIRFLRRTVHFREMAFDTTFLVFVGKVKATMIAFPCWVFLQLIDPHVLKRFLNATCLGGTGAGFPTILPTCL